MPIPIPPGAIPIAKKVAGKLLTVAGPAALKEAKKYWDTDHGSKVKQGAFHEFPDHQITVCPSTNEVRRVLPDLQPFQ